MDQALPQLLIDLEERGLLENTLVCWLTDFGRTPNVESASGRDHWCQPGFHHGRSGVQGRRVGETDAREGG